MTRKQRINLIRIILAAVLTAIAVLLPLEGIWKIVFCLIPYLIAGWDVLYDALYNIFHGKLLDEKFLMTVATAGAFAVGESIEAVAVMLFFQVGELFEGIAVGKSRRNIMALMDIRPDRATVIRDGVEYEVSPEEVHTGEHIVVYPGERIPLDGTILIGATTVDTSALSGESLPVDCGMGDRVISGTVNLSGVITVEVESEFAQSTVSRVLELVENAASKKAKTEIFITRFARVYTPCVVAVAVAISVFLPLVTGGEWRSWIYRGLVFLAVSCPCALVISVPLSFFGGIGRASKEGILIKGASYIEILSKVRTVVFDKTGTLTEGKFSVSSVHPVGITEEELLRIGAYAESGSLHPIAKSLVDAYEGNIDESLISEVTEHAGKGVEVIFEGKRIYAGNEAYISAIADITEKAETAGTVVHIASEEKYLGYIALEDKVKADAQDTVNILKALGVARTVILTGDRKTTAESVGRRVGIDSVRSQLLPSEKVEAVEEMIPSGSPLVFVGDGINDAPVLARSDVGVAMGALGSDAAIEAADVVLMDDKLSKLPRAVKISRKTMRIVRENIILALGIKGLVLILSAFGLAGMWAAIFADVGVMMIAVLNSMRTMIIRNK